MEWGKRCGACSGVRVEAAADVFRGRPLTLFALRGEEGSLAGRGGGGVSLFPSLCAWRGGGRCLERGGEMLILLQLVVAGAMGRRNYYFGGSETQANTADTHWREGKKKGF